MNLILHYNYSKLYNMILPNQNLEDGSEPYQLERQIPQLEQ